MTRCRVHPDDQLDAVLAPMIPVDGVAIPVQRAIADAWASWLWRQVEAGTYTRGTAGTRIRDIRRWLAFLADVAHTDAPTADTIDAYVAWMRPRHTPGTSDTRMGAVQQCYRWAATKAPTGLQWPSIAESWEASWVNNPTRYRSPVTLSHQDLGRVTTVLDGSSILAVRDRAILRCLAAGLGIISLHRAQIEDFDVESRSLTHQPRGHRGNPVVMQLPEIPASALLAYLQARPYANPEDPLFASHGLRTSGCRLSPLGFRLVARRAMLAAGIENHSGSSRLLTNTGAQAAVADAVEEGP